MCYCIWGCLLVVLDVAGCIIDVYCQSILLHLVGILSPRFTHDARSQEHKVWSIMSH